MSSLESLGCRLDYYGVGRQNAYFVLHADGF